MARLRAEVGRPYILLLDMYLKNVLTWARREHVVGGLGRILEN